jgi:ribosomal protein S18 acetylase RimI-like enzyme
VALLLRVVRRRQVGRTAYEVIMEDVEIRLARAGDADPLMPLMQAFNAEEGIPWRPDAMRAAFVELTGDARLGFALVALSAGAPVGYAVVTYGFDLEWAGRDAFVTELFVAAPARRRGVAARLLREAEANATRNATRALHLVVRPANEAAMALYRNAGFNVIPRVLMTKVLAR